MASTVHGEYSTLAIPFTDVVLLLVVVRVEDGLQPAEVHQRVVVIDHKPLLLSVMLPEVFQDRVSLGAVALFLVHLLPPLLRQINRRNVPVLKVAHVQQFLVDRIQVWKV
jgi:hypothetical protein